MNKSNEEGLSKPSEKSSEQPTISNEPFIITIIILIISLTIAYGYYKTISIGLISGLIAISALFGRIAERIILPKITVEDFE